MSSNRPRTFSQPSTGTGFFRSALEILDDDTLDREWVVRNVASTDALNEMDSQNNSRLRAAVVRVPQMQLCGQQSAVFK